MAIGFQGYRGIQNMQPMGMANMRRGGIGGLRGNLRRAVNPMQMGMQAPQQSAMPQGRARMPGSLVNDAMFQGVGTSGPQFGLLAPQVQPQLQQMGQPVRLQDVVSPVFNSPAPMAGMDGANVAMQMRQRQAHEQALQARRLASQQFGPMGGPGFAQPLSPPPPQQQQMTPQPLGGPMSRPQPLGGPQQQQMLGGPQQQGGQAMGGAKWTMEIKPAEGMATGGMIEGGGFNVPQPRIPEEFTEGVEVLNFDSTAPLPELENPNMMTGADL